MPCWSRDTASKEKIAIRALAKASPGNHKSAKDRKKNWSLECAVCRGPQYQITSLSVRSNYFCPLYILPSTLASARDPGSQRWPSCGVGDEEKGEELVRRVKKEKAEHASFATKTAHPKHWLGERFPFQ